jgi:conjugative transfer region protein TrbK
MRRPLADIGALGRALGFVAVAAIIVVIAVHLRRGDEVARAPSLAPSASSDPIARELARCQSIGMAAEDDAGCKAAWAENRRRFFASPPADASSVGPTSEQKTPARVEDR